jgi:hypothetical protein
MRILRIRIPNTGRKKYKKYCPPLEFGVSEKFKTLSRPYFELIYSTGTSQLSFNPSRDPVALKAQRYPSCRAGIFNSLWGLGTGEE